MPGLEQVGLEWVIDAQGCEPASLTDLDRVQGLFTALIGELSLHPVHDGNWHRFPGAGGVTGLQLLEESHIACHTFPEFGSLCLNVFCCRPRPQADFTAILQREFGAHRVQVRQIERPYNPDDSI